MTYKPSTGIPLASSLCFSFSTSWGAWSACPLHCAIAVHLLHPSFRHLLIYGGSPKSLLHASPFWGPQINGSHQRGFRQTPFYWFPHLPTHILPVTPSHASPDAGCPPPFLYCLPCLGPHPPQPPFSFPGNGLPPALPEPWPGCVFCHPPPEFLQVVEQQVKLHTFPGWLGQLTWDGWNLSSSCCNFRELGLTAAPHPSTAGHTSACV